MESFTSYVSVYDSHVGSVPMNDLTREMQDELIRQMFHGDYADFVLEHDVEHAQPDGLWNLVVEAGMSLERTGSIGDFGERDNDDRDTIINFFAPSKLWMRLEEAFEPFDQSFPKTDYDWTELEEFYKQNIEGRDFRTKLRNPVYPTDGMITRLPYHTFSDDYDRGRLSLFVDRGMATQAYQLSGSAWVTILPLVFFGGLLASIPVAIFWSVWAGVGLFALAIMAKKMLTAKAIAWVRTEAIDNRKRYRWLAARGVIWCRRV